MGATEQLTDVLRAEYNVRVAAILELRQMARAICRQRIAEEQEKAESHGDTLFEMQLQPRYPAERDGDEVYVLREKLTLDERQAIISRLRKEARAKLAHAEALEAETESLIRSGKLAMEL